MAASGSVKRLNVSGSRGNRHRFMGFSQRVAAIDVDVVHKVRSEFDLAETPEEVMHAACSMLQPPCLPPLPSTQLTRCLRLLLVTDRYTG